MTGKRNQKFSGADRSGSYGFLQTAVRFVKGVGPRRELALASLGVETLEDLLYWIPKEFQDRSKNLTSSQFQENREVQTSGVVISTKETFPRSCSVRHVFEATLADDEAGTFNAVWFNQRYLPERILQGVRLSLFGKVKSDNGQWRLDSPQWEVLDDEDESPSGSVHPVYPACEGLTQKCLRNIIKEALAMAAPGLVDWYPPEWLKRRQLMSLGEAVQAVHYPAGFDDKYLENWRARFDLARVRLAYDELFIVQLGLAIRKHKLREKQGIAHRATVSRESLTRQFLVRLPFDFTNAQKRSIKEIRSDMISPRPMQRLLQGDVGSGKTVVCLYGLLLAVENGKQGAMMAPTELLARQHFETIEKLTEGMGISVALLHGGMKVSEAKRVRQEISEGKPEIIIGTHALFQEKTMFKDLSFVVIDEQHKFGIAQRASFQSKGGFPDVLITSATPIPRTLALTFYGDLDVSVLDEKPAGRQKIETHWVPEKKRSGACKFIDEQIEQGAQVYVVAPLIEESEKLPTLKSVQERYESLNEKVFSHRRVGLLHGRLCSDEKKQLLEKFCAGECDILVSTTVIEVGVDVPSATIMLIENAERFGLSQLHQLRGRVGRGLEKSYCLLMTGPKCSADGKRRISALVKTNDGFKISEADLEIRGPGEFMGLRQSGEFCFKIADLTHDADLLLQAREDAADLLRSGASAKEAEYSRLRSRWRSLPKRFALFVG